MPKTCLPDVNFWLALTFERHQHHISAKAWMDGASSKVCAFCRTTQHGFLRLATNAKVLGAEVLTMAEAWQAYDAMMDDPRIAFAEEPTTIESIWRSFSFRQSISTKIWTDAYLAAFAQAADFELITFDQGFRRYQGIRSQILA